MLKDALKKLRGDNSTKSVSIFLRSYRRYLSTGRSKSSHQRALRNAFSSTSGGALDVAAAMAAEKYGAYKDVPHGRENYQPGILRIENDEIRIVAEGLKKNGWYILPRQIDAKILDEFEKLAEEQLEAQTSDPHARTEMESLESNWVVNQKLPQALLLDPGALRVAGIYLGVAPTLSNVESWFSFPVQVLQEGSAQNWHWDCDRVRWLKVFVYVTDVDENSGPHAFIEGSHRQLRVSSRSSRFSDEDVFGVYSDEDLKVFSAPRGTVIFEDTRGLHRGTPVVKGHRLVVQVEYAVDGYGRVHDRVAVPLDLRTKATSHPRLFRTFEGTWTPQ